jgi:homoserine dehydrogenase
VSWLPDRIRWTDSIEDTVLAPDVDVVVELMGGLEPALTCIRSALSAGKPVVTANKQVVAHHGAALFALAARAGVELRCEAAAGGAVPIVRALAESLRADRVRALTAVLNGTSNFVLERLERGARLDEAIAEAQALGFAEADPSADLDGDDAAAKLALLSMFAFGASIDPAAIPRTSIRALGAPDFALARRAGLTLKSIAYVGNRGSGTEAWVGPALVAPASPLATTTRARNVVVVTADHSGQTVLAGEGAGGDPTAVAVLSDVLSIAARGSWRPPSVSASWARCDEPHVPYYLRVTLFNRAESLPSAIASLHRAGVAVDHVATLEADGQSTHLGLGLRPSAATAIRDAAAMVGTMPSCKSIGPALPVLSEGFPCQR